MAYVGYAIPSLLLLTLLAFYDSKASLCFSYNSTFLLDNTQSPSLTSLRANRTVADDFRTFHQKFFTKSNIDGFNDKYYYYDDNYNYDYHTTDVEDGTSWEEYLKTLSIQNKYLLLKALGIKDTLSRERGVHSREYYHQILSSFGSPDVIENLLSLVGEFGFLNFCLDTSKDKPYYFTAGHLSSNPIDSIDRCRQPGIPYHGFFKLGG